MNEKTLKCSTCLVNRDIKTKNGLEFYIIPFRMAKINKTSELMMVRMQSKKNCQSYITGGTSNSYRYHGNQCDHFSERWKSTYLNIQLYLFRTYVQRMLHPTTETPAQPYSLLLYSQQSGFGHNLDVPQHTNR